MTDPFDTRQRRAAILASWVASPTRFREDANAEEDLVLGGYADRLLVELAQNAADAAQAAGVPGRLRLRLSETAEGVTLSAANTGAPLSDAGVDALTSLRASSKRDPDTAAVGRFGVGFAAVLAVSDAPELRSRTGGVRFSAADTQAAIADTDHLVAEAARRDGRVPVLRLPWPAPQPPVAGYDTEVLLPLRDAAAATVRALLAAFDPALLLSLPALTTMDVSGRVVSRRDDDGDPRVTVLDDAGTTVRWRVASRGGEIPAHLLANRPVEERGRTRWSVLAAVPVDAAHQPSPLAEPQHVHAPTPSDEPSGLPVRLSATFPLDVSRRRVPSGPLTDLLAVAAGETAADLIAGLAVDGATCGAAVLALVPRPGFAPAPLAASIREATLAALAERAWLPTVGGAVLPPPRVTAVADPLVAPLSDVETELLPAGWWTREYAPVLAGLGVRERDVADVVDLVSGLARPPAWWRTLYGGLAAAATEPAQREVLAALPVPLVDGRTVTGPAGVLLPDADLPAAAVSALGLRIAHPDAVHPLLERLGARHATPRSVLADDRVAVAIAGCYEEEADAHRVADAVLALVASAGLRPGDEPHLADLALPCDDGDWYAAEETLLPGSPLARVVEADAPFGRADAELVDRWGTDALTAVGALATFALLDESDVDIVDVADLHLDGGSDWAALVRRVGGVTIERLRAVRDLEWVRPEAWPDALALLAAEPLRSALADPCHARRANGRRVDVPSYTRWWLAQRPVLDGHRPAELRLPDAHTLAGLYDPAPGDPALAGLLGAWPSDEALLAAATDPDVAADLLARLGDLARTATAALTATVYSRLAAADLGIDPPHHVRVAPDRVVPAEQVVVIDQPWLLSRLGDHHPVAGGSDPAAVADLLDVPLLSELSPP